MTEHGLIFKGAMVLAMLAGRKRQTRRVVTWSNSTLDGRRIGYKGAAREIWDALDWSRAWVDPHCMFAGTPCWKVPYPPEGTVHRVRPIYQPGHLIYVKETWADNIPGCPGGITYRADHNDPAGDGPANPMKWRSAMMMPRRHARLVLPITAVGAGRLQDISEADAVAEGVEPLPSRRGYYDPTVGKGAVHFGHYCWSAREAFQYLWDSINYERGLGWAVNPPTWPISYQLPQEA